MNHAHHVCILGFDNSIVIAGLKRHFFKDRPDNPIAGGMNLLDYDAMVIGNHEFNFGPTTFATMLGQVDFSLLGTAVGSLITGLAGAVWVLFLGRAVDGLSGASVVVSQATSIVLTGMP